MNTGRFSSRNLWDGSEPKEQKLPRFMIAGTFFVLMFTAFMPALQIGTTTTGLFGFARVVQEILNGLANAGNTVDSVLDLLSQYKDLSGLQENAGELAGTLTKYFAKLARLLIVTGILSIAVPLAAAVLTPFSRGGLTAAIGGGALFISAMLKLMMHIRIRTIDVQLEQVYLADYLSIRWNPWPLVIWTLLMALAAAWIVCYMLVRRRQYTRDNMFIIVDDGVIYQEKPLMKGSEKLMTNQGAFYGAIIGEKGPLRGKAFPMVRGERIAFGDAAACESIRVEDGAPGQAYCEVVYDDAGEEYRIVPRESAAVYLGSGQPLGKGRTYCVPRGTQILILNAKNRFTLG